MEVIVGDPKQAKRRENPQLTPMEQLHAPHGPMWCVNSFEPHSIGEETKELHKAGDGTGQICLEATSCSKLPI